MAYKGKQAASLLALVIGALGASDAYTQPAAPDAKGAPAAAKGAIEEIVVTAQKRSENLQKVPISIGVLAGSGLEKSGARSISDQLNQVGGLNLIENSPGQNQISIRGASAGGPLGTGTSPVAYYLDEVPFSFITHAILPDANAYDLQRVEILRGPQGTLYGSSSLNGVVRILTNDANLSTFEVKGRARYGFTESSDDMFSGDLAVNLPIVPGKFAARAVASYADLGGFIDSPTKQNFNEDKIQNYRVKLNAAPTDNLQIKFGAWVSRLHNDEPSQGFSNYTTPFGVDQPSQYDYEAYDLVMNYDFGPFTLLSSSGYIDLRTSDALDYLIASIIPGQIQSKHDAQVFAQELRLTSQFTGPWQVTGGGMYRTINELYDQALPFLSPFPTIIGNKSESYTVFSELTRSLFDDKVKLTGGLRYYTDTEGSAESSSLTTGTSPLLLPPNVKAKFSAVTWRAVASYYPTKDLTLYASAGTGFRSGINQTPDTAKSQPDLPISVNPDELMTEEIGAKGNLLGHHLSYEVAAYHESWDQPQQLVFTITGVTALVNGPTASGYGFSANVNTKITDEFSLYASGDWNSLAFEKELLFSGLVLFPESSRMNTSPETTAAVGGEYRLPIGAGDHSWFLAGSARYNSKMVRHDFVPGAPGTPPNVTVTTSNDIIYGELRTGVDAERWSVSLFIENLTNENGAIAPPPSLFPTTPRMRPRTFGIQGSFKFGG